jgi:hypothetical protein
MNKLIFDIGSNEFRFTDACRTRWPDCDIVAIDPIYEIYEAYNASKHNGKLTYLDKIVSDRNDDFQTININLNEAGMSTISEHYMNNSRFALGNTVIIKQYIDNAALMLKQNPSVVEREEWRWIKRIDFSSISVEDFTKLIESQFGNMHAFLTKVHRYIKRPSQTITIDRLIEIYGVPDLIKIDVEGYESNVIKGLTKRNKKLCFEWNEEMNEELFLCLKLLENLGYEKFGVLGYFEEGDIYEHLTYDPAGDTFLREPQYYSLKEIKSELSKSIDKDRRVNWGMVWAK